MKHFNKILLLLACLSLSSATFAMERDLEDEIENLKDQMAQLQIRLQSLEKQQAATQPAKPKPETFQECRGNSCRRINKSEYQDLARNPRYKCKGGTCKRRGHKGGIVGGLAGHGPIQKQFLALEKKFGIETTPAEMQAIHRVKGPQGNQAQFNAARSALITLLSKPALDDTDVAAIKQKINELTRLNPARWPRAEDFQRILDARQ